MCNKGIAQFYLSPYTRLYSPAARRHRPLAGTHCAYVGMDGQAELFAFAYVYSLLMCVLDMLLIKATYLLALPTR